MQTSMKKYLQILKIELEDLEDDIEMIMASMADKLEEHKITKFVYLENLAVLKNEILGIESFNRLMGELDLDQYDTLDAFIADVEKRFAQKVEDCGLAEAIGQMVHRKLKKVFKYLKD